MYTEHVRDEGDHCLVGFAFAWRSGDRQLQSVTVKTDRCRALGAWLHVNGKRDPTFDIGDHRYRRQALAT